MKTAQNKVLVMGKIQRYENHLVFLANKPEHPEFATHLTDTFNADYPGLATAWVRPQTWTPEDEQPVQPSETQVESTHETRSVEIPETEPTPEDEPEDISAEEWLTRAMKSNVSVQQAWMTTQNAEQLLNQAKKAAEVATAPLDSARTSLAKLRDAMVLRPQPGDARKLAPMIEALGSARLAVGSSAAAIPALAKAHFDAHIAFIEVIEAQATEDEELGNALALAEASGLELPTQRPSPTSLQETKQTDHALGTPGNTAELLKSAIEDLKLLGKGLKDLKLRAKGKPYIEMVKASVPTASIHDIAAAANMAQTTGDTEQLKAAQEALRELMAAVTTALTHGLDTGKQVTQWLEWKDRFPSDQQACLTANAEHLQQTIGQLIDLAEPLSFGQ